VNRTRRYDLAGPLVAGGKRVDGVQVTPDPDTGFLLATAKLSRVGVFDYSDADGSWRELRDAAEVFSDAAVESFRHVVLTDDHPRDFASTKNANRVVVGSVAGARRDGDYLVAEILVTRPDTIDKVLAGKCELSCGYSAIVVDEAGHTTDGERYDARQTEIRGNHVAIVDRGRAGPNCRIDDKEKPMTSDAKDKPMPPDFAEKAKGKDPEGDAPEDKPDPDEETEDEGDAPADKPAAKGDKTDERVAELQAKIDELRKVNSAERIDARVELVSTSRRICPDFKTRGRTDDEIRRAVVETVSPAHKARVADCSSEYLRATYDGAVERHTERSKHVDAAARGIFSAANADRTDLDTLRRDFVRARQGGES